MENRRDLNVCDAFVRDQQREGSDSGHDQLVKPAQVDHVINKAQQDDHTDRQECCVVLDQFLFSDVKQKLLVDRHHQEHYRDAHSGSLGPKPIT